MLRYAIITFVVLVGVAILSGNPRTRRVLWVLAGLASLTYSLPRGGSPASDWEDGEKADWKAAGTWLACL